MPWVGMWIEKLGVDDAVGAVAVHGYCGVFGALAVGIMASGYIQGEGYPATGIIGQLIPTLICIGLLGFLPGYGVSWVLNQMGLLRVPAEEEIEGLDLGDFGTPGYPEYSIVSGEEFHSGAGIKTPQV